MIHNSKIKLIIHVFNPDLCISCFYFLVLEFLFIRLFVALSL